MLNSGSLVDKISFKYLCALRKMFKYPTETTVVSDSIAMCRQTSSTESVQDQLDITVRKIYVMVFYKKQPSTPDMTFLFLSLLTLFCVFIRIILKINQIKYTLTYIQRWKVLQICSSFKYCNSKVCNFLLLHYVSEKNIISFTFCLGSFQLLVTLQILNFN